MPFADRPFAPPFFHGTCAELRVGELIRPGFKSNFGLRKPASWVYFAGTLDAAIWGAELAIGEGPGRIYVVEPTGPVEDDPNLTDKKFPGNPTRSFRSRAPLTILAMVTDWHGHPPERLQQMRDRVAQLRAQGIEAID